MLETLKQSGRKIGHGIEHAWDTFSEGWREMFRRSGQALTHFSHDGRDERPGDHPLASFPHWSLLAGEVEETDREIVVRLELPGMRKEDCEIAIDGNALYVSGEKHAERSSHDSRYHVMERAYGSFRRTIALPRNVVADKATARYSNGVMTIHLPKENGEKAHVIPVA